MTKLSRPLAHPDLANPAILRRIADRLKKELRADKVIVYGSVARGAATIHSDINLLVVAPTTEKGYLRIARAHEVIRDLSLGLPLAPFVLTPEELRRRVEQDDPFIREILEHGVEL